MGVLDVVVKAYEVDEDAAGTLVELAVYDYLSDLAEAYRPAYNAVVGPWALDRVQTAKRHLARGYVSKAAQGTYPEEDVHRVAKWLVGLEQYLVAAVSPDAVAKASGFEMWNLDGRMSNKRVYRDDLGRFARAISSDPQTVRRDPGNFTASTGMHPHIAQAFTEGGAYSPDKVRNAEADVDRAKFAQGQWTQAEQFVTELRQGLPRYVRDDADVLLAYKRNPNSDSLTFARFPLKDVKDGRIPRLANPIEITDTLSHIEIVPGMDASPDAVRQIASLNALGATVSSAAIDMAMTDKDKLKNLSSAMNISQEPRQTGLTRFFRVLESGGSVLSGIGGGSAVGNFARFVGENGPEAERVLGPYVQRAAYRYRGTETTPDKDFVRMINGAEMRQIDEQADSRNLTREQQAAASAMFVGDNESGRRPRASGQMAERLGSRLSIDAAQRKGEGLQGDSLRMQVRSDMAAAQLVQTLPTDPILARLSEKAGTILPSQGLLFNSDGKVVSQAVGFADDHYLPFDLKNLGSMRGGQYVRTRQSGGLTGEDVYAAATVGARMVTVVSPSGVYTLEMAPDFRGARSMSDKARGMYDRYLKILDAVEGSNLYLEDIPESERMKITRDVKSLKLDPEREETMIRERIDARREESQRLTDDRVAEIESTILAQRYNGIPKERLNGADRRRLADDLDEAVQAEQSTLTNKLRLNGQGYAVALQTLQQQYPYFIKSVRYESMNDFAAKQGLRGVKGRQFSRDTGYVRPGGLKPFSTREGFYNRDDPYDRQWKKGERSGASAPAAASPAPTAPAAPGTSAVTPGSQPSAPSIPAPNVGVQSRLNDKRSALGKMAKDRLTRLSTEFQNLPAGLESQVNGSSRITQAPMSDLGRLSDQDKVTWLLGQPLPAQQAALLDPQASISLLSALGNAEAVSATLGKQMSSSGMVDQDYWDGKKFGGAEDESEAMQWMVRQAKEVADAMLLQQPFTGSSSPELAGWQAPTFDPTVSALDTKQKVLDYASRNPDVWERSIDLANDDTGGEYDSLLQVAVKARRSLANIDSLAKVQRDYRAALSDPTRQAPKWADFKPDDAVVDQIADALGKPPDDVSETDILNTSPDVLRQSVNAAWQLAATARVIEFLDDEVLVPKGSGRLVKKAAGRVRVLSATDPLSKAVQMRIAKGLPFVPTRISRSPRMPRMSSRSWSESIRTPA